MITNDQITKAIIRSQHCQRNWDLSREMPKEDLDLMVTAATQCPSKQNIAYYKTHFITNRQVIEEIHSHTDGFTYNRNPVQTTTNTQVLANLLIVFEKNNYLPGLQTKKARNDHIYEAFQNEVKSSDDVTNESLRRDSEVALGVAAGYLNLAASLIGYSTGCCSCFDGDAIQKVLNLERSPVLLMGIGFKDPNLNRRVHHLNHDFVFPTIEKQEIPVNFIQ